MKGPRVSIKKWAAARAGAITALALAAFPLESAHAAFNAFCTLEGLENALSRAQKSDTPTTRQANAVPAPPSLVRRYPPPHPGAVQAYKALSQLLDSNLTSAETFTGRALTNRNAVTQALERAVEAAVKMGPARDPKSIELMRRADVRLRILKGIGEPVTILHDLGDNGYAVQEYKPKGAPEIPFQTLSVNRHFVAADPLMPVAAAVENFDQKRFRVFRPDGPVGTLRDGFYTGTEDSHRNILDQGRYDAGNPSAPIPAPPPLPFDHLLVQSAKDIDRLAILLAPGESATAMDAGSGNIVYLVHPHPPREILDGSSQERVAWARKNQSRLIKITKDDTSSGGPSLPTKVRRAHLARHIVNFIGSRVKFDKKPILHGMKVKSNLLIQRGAFAQDYLPLLKMENIQFRIDEYFKLPSGSPRRTEIRAEFAADRLRTPEEMSARFAAIEQAMRDYYPQAIRLMRANGAFNIANIGPVLPEEIHRVDVDPDARRRAIYEMAVDYNHGINLMWDPDLDGAVFFDPD
jgi:hypothetical protein